MGMNGLKKLAGQKTEHLQTKGDIDPVRMKGTQRQKRFIQHHQQTDIRAVAGIKIDGKVGETGLVVTIFTKVNFSQNKQDRNFVLT